MDRGVIQHHIFNEDDYKLQLEARFWNCQGKHIAIVACITKRVDWAAYIGTDAASKGDKPKYMTTPPKPDEEQNS